MLLDGLIPNCNRGLHMSCLPVSNSSPLYSMTEDL